MSMCSDKIIKVSNEKRQTCQCSTIFSSQNLDEALAVWEKTEGDRLIRIAQNQASADAI